METAAYIARYAANAAYMSMYAAFAVYLSRYTTNSIVDLVHIT